jgi:ribose transport system ATP-binding protein
VTEAAPIALRMRGIQKRFAGVVALSGVDLEVRRGEVHALIGENGAGKSTLMKVLSGAHAPDGGTMELNAQAYAPRNPLAARAAGVAMIYQELTLAPHLTVEENILLGAEVARFGVVSQARSRERVQEALAWLSQAELVPSRRVLELSPGARQLVEVARALVGAAQVVVMDEPTSSLSRREAERLFTVVDRLRERGISVIYISHFFEEVRRVAQRYTVLRDGATVARGEVPARDVSAPEFTSQVIEAMAGRKLAPESARTEVVTGELALELSNLAGVRLPHDASLRLQRGEILGLAGLVGAGRTELVRALFGLDAIRSGSVRIASNVDHGKTPRERLAQGVGLLSEDRKAEGLALNLSIADNLTLSRPCARAGVISPRARDHATRTLAERLSLRYRAPEQALFELSGGNQQKVALARLLHHDVDVLLLDEPTRGIDVSSKSEIYKLLHELARQGKAILFVSSYFPELLSVCHRIAVMSRGRLGEARSAQAWSEATLLDAATAGAHE